MPQESRTQLGAHHLVVAIHGVGSPPSGAIEEAIRRTIESSGDTVDTVQVREFNWNAFVPHAPMRGCSLAEYAAWFSRSFVAAAWSREPSRQFLRFLRGVFEATFHGVLAFGATITALLLAPSLVAVFIAHIFGLIEHWNGGPLGEVIGGVEDAGKSFAWLSGVFERAATTLLGIAKSIALVCSKSLVLAATASLIVSLLESAKSFSSMPFWICLRRLVFILSLVPAVLLSLVLVRAVPRAEDPTNALLSCLYGSFLGLCSVGILAIGFFTGHFWWTFLVLLSLLVLWLTSHIGVRAVGRATATAGEIWLVCAKVLLDISLYVGSPEYRREIQIHLAAAIDSGRRAVGCRSIWLVGHSLGSVIALDCLVNSSVWQGSEMVHLVTLGSPISRLINRFFPAQLFPQSVGNSAGAAALRVGRLTWLNIHRPLDYIGGSLGLESAGRDARTCQFSKAHANYWSDPAVFRELRKNMALLSAVPRSAVAWEPNQLSFDPPTVVTIAVRVFSKARRGIAGTLTVAGAALAVLFGLRGSDQTFSPEVLHPVASEAMAAVTHERRVDPIGLLDLDWNTFHKFTFVIVPAVPEELPVRVTFRVYRQWGMTVGGNFDSRALAKFIRAKCRPLRARRFYEIGASYPCVREGIRVHYDPANPEKLRALDFPHERQGKSGPLEFGVLLLLFLSGLVLLAMLADAILKMALRLLALLTGSLPT